MKKIILIALVAVLCVGTAYASKLEVSGSARYQGTTQSVYNSTTGNTESHGFYDFDMNIFPKFVVDENNYAMLKLAIRDMTGGTPQSGTVPGDYDENLAVERAFISTKIGPTQLSVGLMDGGAWGTTFGDNVNGEWRIKAITTTPVGALVFVLRKVYETETVDGNSDDVDVLYLGFITKAGPMNIKPLVAYAKFGTDVSALMGGDSYEKKVFLLAMDGKFGDISVEFEFGYEDYAADNSTAYDHTLMGALLDVSMQMGDNKFGVVLGYAGVDENEMNQEKAFSYGDERVYTVILDDDQSYGKSQKEGLGGFNMIALYGQIAAMENLTISPTFAYLMSNYDDANATWTIETAMEFDICASYKINDAVSYNVDLGYVMASNFTGDDPDDMWLVRHNLKISF